MGKKEKNCVIELKETPWNYDYSSKNKNLIIYLW